MKTTMKRMLLLAVISTLMTSCGKSSSGGGNSNSPAPVGEVKEFTGNTTALTLEALQARFEELNTSSNGLNVGDIIYHVGPYYVSAASSSGFDFHVSGCINLIVTQIGDCNYGYSADSYWQSIINSGSYKTITSITAEKNYYDRLTDVDNGKMTYQAYSFSKAASLYKSMLALDSSSITGYGVVAPKISVAEVTLTNGQKIEAYLVEKFDGYSNSKYVVSPKLPLMANPIGILDGYGNFIGGLKGVGSIKIKLIKVDVHTTTYSGDIISAGSKQITLN